MIKKLIFIAVFLSFALPVSAGQFKVTRVYDGDTLKATGHDIEIKVRLVSIDTPETKKRKHKAGQPFGQKAKRFLTAMVLNKQVFIKGYGLGPYNRILAVVYVGKKNVNLELIKADISGTKVGRDVSKLRIINEAGLYRRILLLKHRRKVKGGECGHRGINIFHQRTGER